MGGGGVDGVEVIKSKGCSRLFMDISSSFPSSLNFRGLQSQEEPFSPASSSSSTIISQRVVPSTGPFSGLVICVTGLSKEARKQVMDATERLGGQYSPHLHPQCTHLVVQSFCGRKFEYALKHGSRNGLFVVTLGWLVDSVRRNVRLSELLYCVKDIVVNGMPTDDLHQLVQYTSSSCLPANVHEYSKHFEMIGGPLPQSSEKGTRRSMDSTLSGYSFYIDLDVSAELRSKVIEAAAGEGAKLVDQWFVGCNVSHVVCEGPSVLKYLGHSDNLVTPLWVLKTAKEKHVQRLVHISADMARQVGMMLDNVQSCFYREKVDGGNGTQYSLSSRCKESHEERQKITNLAKNGVRKRRGQHVQTCQTLLCPMTPSSLLDSICWSISEPTSTASIYTDSIGVEDASEHRTSLFFDAKGDGKESDFSFVNFSRPLTECEKTELIVKSHFLTILFPIDRFAEMGPCSRTFFSDAGFTCAQVLDYIYAFYQENMSAQEIQVAIHTDSRHADRLRSVYSSKETAKHGYVAFKRIDFLGSRKSFEMLKRVTGDNNSNVYMLLIRA